MSKIGIKPELKKKIFNIEYKALTSGYNQLNKEEMESLGGDKATIGKYLAMSQKRIPFHFINCIRGELDNHFFEKMDEIIDWFTNRSSFFTLALIPDRNLISFVNKLFEKGFKLGSYLCYWYQSLENLEITKYASKNIKVVNQDLIEDFSNAALKGFGFDSTPELYDVFDEFSSLNADSIIG